MSIPTPEETNLQNQDANKSSLTGKVFSRSLINLLRTCRHFAYLFLTPFDYVCRLVNGKADFPPLHLRRHVGPLRSFEASGAEFMSYLRLLVGMQPDEHMLDIGCGCGLMVLHLKDYFDTRGSYVGVDLHRPSVKWCRKRFGSEHQNFRFEHIDVKSLAYNPRGRYEGASFVFPHESNSFDVVLVKSVFTHLRPIEVENYLGEIARLLKKDGRCLATFFLLNPEQKALEVEGRNVLSFSFGTEEWRYVYENSPESASAYDEGYILRLLAKHRLRLRGPIYYGHWSGRKTGLSFQDMLIIERVQ
ncbi:MAG TPA: class I SAM-dependent methyltransferase [Pyrinomonadaceae bacterium]|nr:class I SAM-dependent methyltransferase [Pyrinomonadaceae bacterium]